jgi:hypothetical protein
MAHDGKFYGDPNYRPPDHSLPVQQFSQGSVLIGVGPIERDSVDRALRRSQLLGPDDLAIYRNAALIGPEQEQELGRRIKVL